MEAWRPRSFREPRLASRTLPTHYSVVVPSLACSARAFSR
jgi:hypothetical protein